MARPSRMSCRVIRVWVCASCTIVPRSSARSLASNATARGARSLHVRSRSPATIEEHRAMKTSNQPGNKRRKLQVLIVDDHPIFRTGISQLIDQEPDLAVCGEAETTSQAMKAVAACQPDIVVVDVTLKG